MDLIKRLIAFYIDVFFSMLFLAISILILCLLGVVGMDAVDMISFLTWGMVFCKDCYGGRSPGKYILGYMVIDRKTNMSASPLKCVIRNAFLLLGVIDIIFSLLKGRQMRLGDYVAQTQVVKFDKNFYSKNIGGAIITFICVMSVTTLCYYLLVKHVTSLGLFGLLYANT